MFASAAAAQTPGFWLTGLAPQTGQGWVTSLSQDGGTAAGYCFGVPRQHPASAPGFTWTRQGGRHDFGLGPGMPLYSVTNGINSDGGVLVGYTESLGVPPRAYRRVGNGPLQDLGILAGQTRSWASGVSGNGSIVVGASEHTIPSGPFSFDGGEAFRWTESGGMQGLGYLRPNGVRSRALGISRDGLTIVGSSQSDSVLGDVEAFRWTAAGGMEPLPNLPGGAFVYSEALAASADGSVIVGYSPGGAEDRAVRWTSAGIENLGILPGFVHSRALTVSDDGTVVGGTASGIGLRAAIVWTPSTGMVPLADYLLAHGVATPGQYRLDYVCAISGDGLTFAGEAVNLLTNVREGFVATIPCPATFMAFLSPLLARRRRRS